MYGAELWLAGAILLVVAMILVSGLRVRLVSQQRRLVIYRLGRLHRIIGPGIVWWYALVDREVRGIDVHEEPLTPFIDGLLIHGLPVNLTLNLWLAFNPSQAVGPGRDPKERERLANLLELSDEQREEQAVVQVREQLSRQLAVIAANYPLPANATVIDQLMPVFPGTPQRDALMKNLHAALKAPLAQIGYVLSDRPLTVVQLYPPQDLIAAFSRNRIIEQLRQKLPGLPDETVAQIIASIEGREQMNVQKMVWEGNIPPAAHLEYQPDSGILRQKVMMATPPSNGETHPPKTPANEEVLSQTDLAVLKRVPPSQRRGLQAAGGK